MLTRVLENQTPYPQLFQQYLQCLTSLAVQPNQLEPTLRTFEFHTLKALGYGVDFTHCAATGECGINFEKTKDLLLHFYRTI